MGRDTATAKVKCLTPGGWYKYVLYQETIWDRRLHPTPYSVNGVDKGMTTPPTTNGVGVEAATGEVQAQDDGTILFTFLPAIVEGKTSLHSDNSIGLQAMAIAACLPAGKTFPPTPAPRATISQNSPREKFEVGLSSPGQNAGFARNSDPRTLHDFFYKRST